MFSQITRIITRISTQVPKTVAADTSSLIPKQLLSTSFSKFYEQPGSPFWPKYDRLTDLHLTGKPRKHRPDRNPLGPGVMVGKGVVIRTVIRKPKKPNSANRKCVLIRLSNGKEAVAYVPGEGHNLQEHSVVLVEPRPLGDCPGVKLRCIRGARDLGHVVKKAK